MSDLDRYTKATVYLNGRLLTEESDVSVKRMSGGQAVKTTAKGFAGMSPGSSMLSISMSNAVPSDDFEYDPSTDMEDLEIVEITVFAAGRTLTSKGFVTDDNFSHTVDSPSKLSFEFTGQYAKWE